jgi:hypothetical protein
MTSWKSFAIAIICLAVVGLLWLALYPGGDAGRGAAPSSPTAIPLAVVGDSMSHSYQDPISFPPGSPGRGGTLRPKTFQWTEVIARLRGKELDLGPWVDWGRPTQVAWARELFGIDGGRAPRKQDYLYNFANSGATCTNLLGVGFRERARQVPRLIAMMDRDPDRWKKGVVVIRLVMNDWTSTFDALAQDPNAPEVRSMIDFCSDQIRKSIALIRASHPQTRIMVVGPLNDSDDPAYADQWRSDEEIANFKTGTANFNAALRKMAAEFPRTAVFDDQVWSEQHWGAHSSPKKPYRNVIVIGGSVAVANEAGDDPHNSVLGDHHAGLAWNTLWAQSFVNALRDDFQLPLTPISDQEVAGFILPLVQPGGN